MITREKVSEYKFKARTLTKELLKQKELYEKRDPRHFSKTISYLSRLSIISEAVRKDPQAVLDDNTGFMSILREMDEAYNYLRGFNRIHNGLMNLVCSLKNESGVTI